MTGDREKRLKRAMEGMDESTKAGAIDRALNHSLADKRAKEEIDDPNGSDAWLDLINEALA